MKLIVLSYKNFKTKLLFCIALLFMIFFTSVTTAFSQSQKKLARIAVESSDSWDRAKAVSNLKPEKWQDLIADIAKNDKDDYVRKAAVHKLTSQEVLTDIAKHDKDKYVRNAAFEEITSQEAFTYVAKYTIDRKNQDVSLHKITDQVLIADIAKNGIDYFYRSAAVSRLDPKLWQELLIDIAINDKSPQVRYEAILKIYSEDILASVAKNESQIDPFMAAIKNLDPEKWQELFADIARSSKNDNIRIEAIKRLDSEKWQEVIADIAKIDKSDLRGDIISRIAAIKRLDSEKWQELLADIAKNDYNSAVQITAIKKLYDQTVLYDIAKNNSTPFDVRAAAIQNLNNKVLLDKLCVNTIDENITALALIKLIFNSPYIKKYYNDLSLSSKTESSTIGYGESTNKYHVTGMGGTLHEVDIWVIILNGPKLISMNQFSSDRGKNKEYFDVSGYKTYTGKIDVNKICDELLRPFNNEDLIKIINSTKESIYLKRAAKKKLDSEK